MRTCSQDSDCPKAGANPPFDGDNWKCESGRCRWLGCLNDGECAFFGGVCRLGFLAPATVKTCTEGCQETSVCVENLMAVDLDNWSCTDGGCKYTGCRSDDECVADLGPGSKCLPGDPFKQCAKGCTAPADCVTPNAPITSDADNYECRDGVCEYVGCSSDSECVTAESAPAVCTR